MPSKTLRFQRLGKALINHIGTGTDSEWHKQLPTSRLAEFNQLAADLFEIDHPILRIVENQNEAGTAKEVHIGYVDPLTLGTADHGLEAGGLSVGTWFTAFNESLGMETTRQVHNNTETPLFVVGLIDQWIELSSQPGKPGDVAASLCDRPAVGSGKGKPGRPVDNPELNGWLEELKPAWEYHKENKLLGPRASLEDLEKFLEGHPKPPVKISAKKIRQKLKYVN